MIKLRHLLRIDCWNARLASKAYSNQSANKPPVFIATPIFYVNSVPHIGHLYTTVYADALHRFSKLVQPQTEHIFCTGTDEHGLKVQKSAQLRQTDTQSYCDCISSEFHTLFKRSDIDFTHFNRTTDPRHVEAVQTFWNRLNKRGFIYKSKYEGYYSVNDECFVSDNLIGTNDQGEKVSLESGHPVEWHGEENYMFRLSQLREELLHWINNRVKINPSNFHSVLIAESQNPKVLQDISISRVKSRLQWGIEVPGDPEQVIYVWFDALVNYLTPSGYPDLGIWPPAHVIGKEILKFHAIYWPAFLIAADIEPPREIFCHSHWLCDDHKMSKSKGNVVDPNDCIERFTSDGIRFFLLKEGAPHSDSNFSMDKVKICLNSELANNLGNLLSRCTSRKLNVLQTFPRFELTEVLRICPEAQNVVESSRTLAAQTYEAYVDGNFYIGIAKIMDFLRSVNGFINVIEPWKLKSSPEDRDKLSVILCTSLESIRISSILLQPVMPTMCSDILDMLRVAHHERSWQHAQTPFEHHGQEHRRTNLEERKTILFPKLV